MAFYLHARERALTAFVFHYYTWIDIQLQRGRLAYTYANFFSEPTKKSYACNKNEKSRKANEQETTSSAHEEEDEEESDVEEEV